jgi:hypothetical protein
VLSVILVLSHSGYYLFLWVPPTGGIQQRAGGSKENDMKLFNLGTIVFTKRIQIKYKSDSVFAFFVEKTLQMHSSGNWGDVCDEDWESNQNALRSGGRLFSAYWLDDNQTEKIWIITEEDRSTTTVLYPDEY